MPGWLINQSLRRVFVRDRKLVLGSPACRTLCCGECSAWLHLVQCVPLAGPDCGGNNPPEHIYICAAIRCTNGEPLTAGTTVLIDEQCWVVQPGTLPSPPPGARVVDLSEPVQCLPRPGNLPPCSALGCPTGPLYYPAYPCGGGARRWVCGATRCEIRLCIGGCVVIDPSFGGIPFDRIPPEEYHNIIFLSECLPTPLVSCCDCPDIGCIRGPVTAPEVACPDGFQGGCCCGLAPDGRITKRIRVRRMTTFQQLITPNGPPFLNGQVEIHLTNEQIDANGCARYDAVGRGDGFGNNAPVFFSEGGLSFGCDVCQFEFRAPRLIRVAGSQRIIGGEGGSYPSEWGTDCTGYDTGTGYRLTAAWSSRRTCNSQTQTATYTFTTPQPSTLITRYEWEAQLVPWGSDRDECSGMCGGRIKGGAQAPQPNAGFGPLDPRRLILGK